MTRHDHGRLQRLGDWCKETVLGRYLVGRDIGLEDADGPVVDQWVNPVPAVDPPSQDSRLPGLPIASQPTEALSPAMIAHLEKELESMRALVRREVGGRLAAVELGNGPGWGGPWWRRLWRRRSDWLAMLLVGGLLWTGWQLRELRGQQAGDTAKADGDEQGAGAGSHVMEPDPVTPPANVVVADPPRGDSVPTADASAGETADASRPFPMDLSDPVVQWRIYLSKNLSRIPSWAAAIANTTHKISETQRSNFGRYGADPARTIRTNTAEFLLGAFEVAVRSSVASTLPGAVDLSIGKNEYSAQNLREAADKLGVGSLLAGSLDTKSTKVRVGIAVAYLEQLPVTE